MKHLATFLALMQIDFAPATVRQTGFPKAISVSKKGPPIETTVNRSLILKKWFRRSWEGVIN